MLQLGMQFLRIFGAVMDFPNLLFTVYLSSVPVQCFSWKFQQVRFTILINVSDI